MTHDEVTRAYQARSGDVEQILGTDISATDPDRNIIEPWAADVQGPILDVGSGTGRWTGHLATSGYDIEGLEPVQKLVDRARARYPGVTFHHGSIAQVADMRRTWDGILAWYSVIHMDRSQLLQALAELRGVLTADGTLLMSFFSGPTLTTYDHPVAPVYAWPMDQMAQALETTGFMVTNQHWVPTGPHAYVIARTI